MNYEKQAALVGRLYRSTVAGKLKWQDTPRENAFEASFPALSVILSSVGDNDYTVQVVNKDGEIADIFTDENLRDVHGAPFGYTWYNTLKELHLLARRQARGADDALDQILSALDEEGDE